MKKKLFKELMYAILMIFFMTISYILLNTGINTITKLNIKYQEKSTSHYDIKVLENDIYDLKIKNNDWNILSNLIDDIKLYYNYQNIFSEKATGYYKYNINLKEILYKNNDVIAEKEYINDKDKVSLIDSENIIIIDDYIIIDYDYYRKLYEEKKAKYDINPDGKLLLTINIYEFVSFNKEDKDIPIENSISFEIPLSDEIIKIKANNINNLSALNQLSKKENINYILIILGLIFLSLGITFLITVIKIICNIYTKEKTYKQELNKILTKNDNKIINVKQIINIKKFNLIYVESFKELLDVYKQYKNPISFKETKKNKEAVFIIINEDTAWIYKLNNY